MHQTVARAGFDEAKSGIGQQSLDRRARRFCCLSPAVVVEIAGLDQRTLPPLSNSPKSQFFPIASIPAYTNQTGEHRVLTMTWWPEARSRFRAGSTLARDAAARCRLDATKSFSWKSPAIVRLSRDARTREPRDRGTGVYYIRPFGWPVIECFLGIRGPGWLKKWVRRPASRTQSISLPPYSGRP